MLIELIGTLGAFLIAASWIPETIRTVKTKATGLEIKFISIYLTGSIFLAVYSIAIQDYVFIGLNSFASLLAIVNFVYTLLELRQKSTKVKSKNPKKKIKSKAKK